MPMQQIFIIVHVVIGLLLVVFILLQDKGTGLSAAFGGSGGFYASKRGVAKVVHSMTIALGVLFFASALVATLAPKPLTTPPTTEIQSVTTDKGSGQDSGLKVETLPIEPIKVKK